MELEIIKSSKPAPIMPVILFLFLSDIIFTKIFQETEMWVLKCLEFQTIKFSPKTYI